MAKVGPVQIVAFAVAASAVACSVDVRGSEVSTREEKRFTVSATEPVELKLVQMAFEAVPEQSA